jgi:hypothetical protein
VTLVGENSNIVGGVAAGVCLQVNATSVSGGGASFRLIENGVTVLARGDLLKCKPLDAWTQLELNFKGA